MFATSPAFTIPKDRSPRQQLLPETPSSTQYNLNTDILKRKFPAWKVGTSRRIQFKKQVSPGPSEQVAINGSYRVKPEVVLPSSPKYLIVDRKKSRKQHPYAPGPSTYRPQSNHILKSVPQISFPKQKRNKSTNEQSPGPGTYRLRTEPQDCKSIVFTKQQRFYNTVKQQCTSMVDISPSKQAVLKRSPSHKFPLQIRKPAKYDQFPSPFHYEAQYSFVQRNSSKTIIGKQKRINKIEQSKKHIPGPADYSTTLNQTHRSFTMGRSQRSLFKTNNVPGPAHYHPKPVKSKSPNPVISRSTTEIKNNNVPAPWAYNTSQTDKSRGAVFGREKRSQLTKTESPGPGAYTLTT